MQNENTKRIIKGAAAILIALISFFGVAKFAASADSYPGIIQSLDDKKATVMEMTAVTTAASVALSMIPGDTAMPTAEKLSDLSGYFLIILCAIFLEKYLLTLFGFAAFKIMIPLACLIFAANLFLGKERLRAIALKLTVLGLALYIAIPAGVWISAMIEETYDTSLQDTITAAEEMTETIESNTEEDEEGVLSWITSKVTGGISQIKDKAENLFNNMLEGLAIMLVTSCLIPILVMVFILWIIKCVSGLDIAGKAVKKLPKA